MNTGDGIKNTNSQLIEAYGLAIIANGSLAHPDVLKARKKLLQKMDGNDQPPRKFESVPEIRDFHPQERTLYAGCNTTQFDDGL